MQREFNVEKADVAAVRRYSLAKCSGGRGGVGGGGMEEKGRRIVDMDSRVVTAGRRGT